VTRGPRWQHACSKPTKHAQEFAERVENPRRCNSGGPGFTGNTARSDRGSSSSSSITASAITSATSRLPTHNTTVTTNSMATTNLSTNITS
jgi:hypothetical protein